MRALPACAARSTARKLTLGLAAGLLGLAAACGGSGRIDGELPLPALGSSREAQAEYLVIVRRWATASRLDRIAMEPELTAFRQRFRTDDLGRIVDALISWAALERGELDRAERLSQAVQAKGAGTARDLAKTVEGAALRRRGKPEEALLKLAPLVSKLIDGYARSLLNEEIVLAAIEAKRWSRAIDLMSVWLREAELDEQGRVRGRIEQLVHQVPSEELSKLLDARQAEEPGNVSGDERDLFWLLAQELAAVARARRDVRLAQHLMATSGPLLGKQGEEIAQLAAGEGKARVEAPTVGLLLSLRSDETRRHGVEVAAGVMHGLNLPGSSARLVSRNDGGNLDKVQEALGALTADGAAILIAGVDETEATEAASFAEERGIPVVLLRPPAGPVKPDGFVFVLGTNPAQVRAALTMSLAEKGAERVVLIADLSGPDARTTRVQTAMVEHTCGELFDVAAWKALGINGVLLDGSASCSRAALSAAMGLPSVRFAFGLEALIYPAPSGSLMAAAGHYPIVAQATNETWMKAWEERRRTPPSWWSALGRDAGVLAWEGVEALPIQGTEEPKEIQARRLAAREALASARAELWTTETQGFEGGRNLSRRISVRMLPAGPRR